MSSAPEVLVCGLDAMLGARFRRVFESGQRTSYRPLSALPTSKRSRNALAGTLRRELLDHVLMWSNRICDIS